MSYENMLTDDIKFEDLEKINQFDLYNILNTYQLSEKVLKKIVKYVDIIYIIRTQQLTQDYIEWLLNNDDLSVEESLITYDEIMNYQKKIKHSKIHIKDSI